MLIIVAAMEEELTAVRQGLTADSQPSAELHVIGVGKDAVQAWLKRVMASRKRWPADSGTPEGLLLLGFAGGIDPSLNTGDLVLPERYFSENGAAIDADSGMWCRAKEAAMQGGMTTCSADSITVDKLARDPVIKAGLHRRYHVGTVNMEDYWVAQAAAEAGAPFISVRAVLDTAAQSLPAYVSRLAGNRRRAMSSTLLNPWRVPTLLKLAQQMRLAQESLGRFALEYLAHRQPATELEPAKMG